MNPTTTPAWTSKPGAGFQGLELNPDLPLQELGPRSCLLRIEAVSLNHRDIAIPLGTYPMPGDTTSVVPCSDASATIVATGPDVTLFKTGDHVCTTFNPSHQSGYFNPGTRKHTLGSAVDGILRKFAVFDETALVAAPAHLTLVQASTLSCAAVTAWNALYGLQGRSLKPGHFVLTQGTGGVSLFAAQIALAAGCKVIATTSSNEKADRLKELGVHHVINYAEERDWGAKARELTPGEVGVDHVIDVGGDANFVQSMKAVKMEGVVSVIGFLAAGDKKGETVKSRDYLTSLAIVRGTTVGSRQQFQEMNTFLEAFNITPIVDQKVFAFEEVQEAFQFYSDQSQWGKVVIKI